MSLFTTKWKNYHLVLSWGGLKGFAHIGVYKALVEHGYHIVSVAGTSMGSLIGLFIAAGKTPGEIETTFCQKPIYRLLNLAFSKEWALSTKTIQRTISQEIHTKNIEDLLLPFTVCVTDIDIWQPIYYTKWDITKTVTWSCAVPWLFKPIPYDGRYLVDWWVCDNFPVSTGRGLPILWSNVNPFSSKVTHSAQWVVIRALRLLISRDISKQRQECEIFFEPPRLATVWQALFMSPKKIIQIGYDHANTILKDMKSR
jgi:NTE family protein